MNLNEEINVNQSKLFPARRNKARTVTDVSETIHFTFSTRLFKLQISEGTTSRHLITRKVTNYCRNFIHDFWKSSQQQYFVFSPECRCPKNQVISVADRGAAEPPVPPACTPKITVKVHHIVNLNKILFHVTYSVVFINFISSDLMISNLLKPLI